jgi:hypothetical protein
MLKWIQIALVELERLMCVVQSGNLQILASRHIILLQIVMQY